MSADFLSIGWTNDDSVNNDNLTREDVEAVVEKYVDDLVRGINEWDLDDDIEYLDSREDAVYLLTTGLHVLASPFDYAITPIGDTGYVHYSMGGTSYGDAPFDEWSAVCATLNAIDYLPEMGKEFGVIGGGIVLPEGWGPNSTAR